MPQRGLLFEDWDHNKLINLDDEDDNDESYHPSGNDNENDDDDEHHIPAEGEGSPIDDDPINARPQDDTTPVIPPIQQM